MKFKFLSIIKILCIAFCAVFLLSACSSESRLCSSEKDTEASAQSGECWQRELLSVFYSHVGNMALNAYRKITTENLMSVMALAFAVWFAFQILGHVAATTPDAPGEFWNKIIRKASLCFICGTLASTTGGLIYTINTFIFPIYITLLEFASRILDITNSSSTATALYIDGGEDGFQICEQYKNVKAGTCTIAAQNITFSDSKFPTEPLDLMGCMACAVADRLNVGYTIAMKLLCLESVIGVIVAVLLVAGFTIAKFCFALYLVDSIFRMDMMLIILPFLIMFYPFEQTRKWTGVGFKFILNSAAIMLCLVILVATTILAMERILIAPQMNFTFSEKEFTSMGPIPFSIMFLAFVIIKASSLSVTLSNSVTGGSGETRFQKNAKAVLQKIGQIAFEIVSHGAGKAVTAAVQHFERLNAIAQKVKKAKEKIARAKSAMNRVAGRGG